MGTLRFEYEEDENLYRKYGFRYHPGGGDCYFVYEEDEVVGVVWLLFYDQSDYEDLDEDLIHLDLVEVLDPGKGLGSRIVDELFESFEVGKIKGQVMYDDRQKAYFFWESLGAYMFSVHIDRDTDEEVFSVISDVDDFIYTVKHLMSDVEFEYTKK